MKKSNKIYTALIFVFLYLPIAVLILFSFNSSNSTNSFAGFSLKWYKELFSDGATLLALRNTLILAILSSVIATVIGTLAAYGIHHMKNKHIKNTVLTVNNIPMMNPEIVVGISMMLLFVFVGRLINSSTTLGFGTVLIAHVTFNIPYVVLSVMPKFKQMDRHLPEAALDLGCTPFQSFYKVEMPQIISGIISGFIMAFTLSIDDFIISYFTIGSGFETLPIRIYSMTKKRVTPDMYALSALIFLSILILLLISNFTGNSSGVKEKKPVTLKQKKRRRIVFAATFALIAIITGAVLISTATTETVVVNVYNWGEYISDGSDGSFDSNKAFEDYYSKVLSEERGHKVKVQVNYTTYTSNEDLYAKIKSGVGGYDVIVPSDYMVERLIKEGLVQPLDLNNIPNYKYIKDDFKKPFYDNGEETYSVMYTYGIVGIIYNTEYVDEEDIGGWDLLWNEKYSGHILQFNNARDAFGSAMYKEGINVNTATELEWRNALNELKRQKPLVQSYVMDEVYNKLESEEAWIGAYYAGDALSMIYNNENLAFYYPKNSDGEFATNIFADAMCIPTGVSEENKKHAEAYINFMLSEEPAIANAEYIYYGCPNTLVTENPDYIEYLGEDYDVIYDPDIEDNIDILFSKYAYRNLPTDKLALLNRLWEELKVDSSSFNGGIYIVSGVIALGIVGFIVFCYVRKVRRRRLYWNTTPKTK
ncbi:MAG: extracellular solute-binding protein [Clostridia bacterium]|nr:extracellular solute-binding protein [Clostridia bacterium]